MTFTMIKNGSNFNHGNGHKEFQIDSLSSDLNSTIQAELATLPDCAPGSTAINAALDLFCVKKNDGTWQINK